MCTQSVFCNAQSGEKKNPRPWIGMAVARTRRRNIVFRQTLTARVCPGPELFRSPFSDRRRRKMERKKSERQRQLESPEHLSAEGTVRSGRSGGNMAREVGSRDELKRAFERPSGKTRVTKSVEEPGRPRPRKPGQRIPS
jgi:hypothetical protein